MSEEGLGGRRVERYGDKKVTGEPVNRAWWTVPKGDVWRHMIAVSNAIDADQRERINIYARNARLYSGREFASFQRGQWQRQASTVRKDRISLNVIRSCVDTGAAKIAKNKPRPLYLTNGGNFTLQRKAKARTKYVEGLFEECRNWHLMQRQFVDGEIYGLGVKRWYIDWDAEKVRAERVLVHQLRIDEEEGRHGDPRQLHTVVDVPVAKLVAMFPKHKAAIYAAANGEGSAKDVESVTLYEGFHLGDSASGKGGRWVLAIDKLDLQDEPWEFPWFPFTFYRWSDALEGFHGESLVDELVGIQVEINRLLRTIQTAQHLACVPRVYLQAGSEITNELTNEMGAHYYYQGAPPVVATASAMPPEVYTHLWELYRKAYEITGFSQLSASGKKPAGLDAAVALREMQDIETERFVLKGQRYEELALDDARISTALTGLLAAKGKAPKLYVSDRKSADPVDWADGDLSDDSYIVRAYPTNFLPATPAGKLQTIKEMAQEGVIETKEEKLALLDYPDLEEFTTLSTAQLEATRMVIESILEKGKMIEPTSRDVYGDGGSIAIRLGNLSLRRAETQGYDPRRIEMLDEWLEKVEALMPAPAAPPPPPMLPGDPGGMPPDPGAMGMPPVAA